MFTIFLAEKTQIIPALCQLTGYRQKVICQVSGKAFRSCEVQVWQEECRFWMFEAAVAVAGPRTLGEKSKVAVVSMQERASIYLRGHVGECEMWVTADTLAALFTLQYCQNHVISVFIVEPGDHMEASMQQGTTKHNEGTSQCSTHHEQDTTVVQDEKDKCLFPVDPSTFSFTFSVLDEKSFPSVLTNCMLPAAVLISESMWCVAGLCSSLRFVLNQTVEHLPQHHASHLLGFRGSCLQACAEVSVWTKFCEVEALKALREIVVHDCLVKCQGKPEKAENRVQKEESKKKLCEGRSEKTKYQGNEVSGNARNKVEEILGSREEIAGRLEEVNGALEETGSEVEEVVVHKEKGIGKVKVAAELIRYERHLERPPLLHNALKVKHRYIRATVQDKAERERLLQLPLAQLPDLEHTFAEGLNMTLADVLLFVSFHILLTKLQSHVPLDGVIPLVLKWHKVILASEYIREALPVLSNVLAQFCPKISTDGDLEIIVPRVPNESIYKSDPERYKPRWRSFTHQVDIDAVLDILAGADVEFIYSDHPVENISLPWSSFPNPVNPREGHLPPIRLERKCQQLENMVSAVEWVAQDGDIIVDFCAGGGHVGIVLAYRLPQCKVLLVENKEASLLRAKERVEALELKNVVFVQCNLDYFQGSFQVGVSLHACGVATDLVMLKCFEQQAAFVCSPCCYGGVQANHILAYPRSQIYKDLSLTQGQYLTLGHGADQTHGHDNPKTSQGQQCMRLVDSDRLAAAQELGYSVSLTLMQPPQCTPKNHLLIGVLPRK
ncbi:hypothetical protein Pcinc_017889 [Petrolisthes cinctipes]|uniref:Methyltransferase domain-containing protein n=1 Tax=Petrolisthes cinctipes TaxID=88211 RepID=A0AAE1FQJ3_PETCI|nr:hypothetical protein Pcinc_017889 [Petrolisthes cinctipes]